MGFKSPTEQRRKNLAGQKRPPSILQSIFRSILVRHEIWHLALRIGAVKKSTNFIRVGSPVRSMRIGAAKEPAETTASSESDITAEEKADPFDQS
jgi:hypothetical protein